MTRRAITEWVEPLLTEHLSRNNRRADTAIALEGAVALVEAAASVNAKRILDLGSGFSSLVLREWAKRQDDPDGIEVISTDTHPGWLSVTKLEVEGAGFDPATLMMQEDFEASDHGLFDLIFVDWSNVESRLERLDDIISWAAPGALLVFDDYHFLSFAAGLRWALKKRGLKWQKDAESLDQFRRVQVRVSLP